MKRSDYCQYVSRKKRYKSKRRLAKYKRGSARKKSIERKSDNRTDKKL